MTRLEKERKWVARVWVDSKQKTVGRYDSDIAAAQVRGLLCPRAGALSRAASLSDALGGPTSVAS